MVWIVTGVIVFLALLVFLLALCRAAGTDDREFEDAEQMRAIRAWQEEKELKRMRRSDRSKRP